MARVKHPVLDQYPHWRAYADQHGLGCLDREWHGVNHPYAIVCAKGHVRSKFLNYWTKAKHPCAECLDQERMERLSHAAKAIGAVCLDAEWTGAKSRYRFKCAHGHIWSRPWAKCFESMHCTHCKHEESRKDRLRKDGLAALRQAAIDKGGICEASVYIGGNAMYGFRCAQQHRWQATGAEVLRGSWCWDCANQTKRFSYLLSDGLARLQASAAAKGGVCLSESYQGAMGRYSFRCSNSHEWKSVGARVMRGGWCIQCAHDNKRLTLADAQAAAKTRGGQCLSTSYISSSEKMVWVCDRGHCWDAALGTIRAGHWCRQCADLDRVTNKNSKAGLKYRASSRHDQA